MSPRASKIARHATGRRLTALLAGGALAVSLAACGTVEGKTKPKEQVTYSNDVASLFEGTYAKPAGDPIDVPADKSVWFISCGQASTVCASAATGTERAAKAVGWRSKTFDGKFDPTVQGQGIRLAIAAGADAVVIYASDCAPLKKPLEEANAAGLIVIGVEALDCSETSPGTKSLFDARVTYTEGSYAKWIEAYGAAQAKWLASATKGKGKVINLVSHEAAALGLIAKGFSDGLKQCTGCSLTEVDFRLSDTASVLQQKVEQALLKNPEIDAIAVPSDGQITQGVGAAVKSAGRDIWIMGAEGQEANMDLVRAGAGQDAGVGIPPVWEGWAAVDAIARQLLKLPAESSGIGLQIYDKGHNTPESGAYQAPVDYEAAYRSLWGLS